MELAVRYFHFLAILIMFATVCGQHLLLSKQIDAATLKKAFIIDAIYGISALLVLACGLSLWFILGKPAAFYNGNWIFHIKVTLFVLTGLLSIRPTVFFNKARGSKADIIDVPPSVLHIIRLEILLLAVIPLLAILMARGIGQI